MKRGARSADKAHAGKADVAAVGVCEPAGAHSQQARLTIEIEHSIFDIRLQQKSFDFCKILQQANNNDNEVHVCLARVASACCRALASSLARSNSPCRARARADSNRACASTERCF